MEASEMIVHMMRLAALIAFFSLSLSWWNESGSDGHRVAKLGLAAAFAIAVLAFVTFLVKG